MYEIFEKLLEEKGLSLVEFSRLSGIPKSTLYDWKKGKFKLKEDKRRIIAEYFDVDLDYLDGRSQQRRRLNYYDVLQEKKVSYPLHQVAAGSGAYNPQYALDSIEDTENGFEYAVVKGDSMLPELRDGDVVKIELLTQTNPHDYTLLKINGDECTVKFVEVVNNGVWVRALNKSVFEDKFYSIQEVLTLPIQILGRAVEVRRPL